MPTVSRTFSVVPPPATVLDYLKDFAHTEEWDPGTQTCTRTDAGPVDVGATWHNVSKIMGIKAELDYTLTKRTDDQLVFVGTTDNATTTDTISVTPSGSGSEITYEAVLELRGAAKLAEPLIKLEFEKLANDTQKQMTEVLDKL